MRICNFALASALGFLTWPQALEAAEPNQEVESLAGRLARTEQVEGQLERATARSAIFFEARDFGSALSEISEGLQVDPESLILLWRAAASELWLADGQRARGFNERLRAAIAAADLSEDERAGWFAAADEFEARARDLLSLEEAGKRSLVRARLTVGVIALGGLLLIGWLVGSQSPEERLDAA